VYRLFWLLMLSAMVFHCAKLKKLEESTSKTDEKKHTSSPVEEESQLSNSTPTLEGKPDADAAKPGADAAKPGADAAKPGADAAKPGADAAKPGADAAKPKAGAEVETQACDPKIAPLWTEMKYYNPPASFVKALHDYLPPNPHLEQLPREPTDVLMETPENLKKIFPHLPVEIVLEFLAESRKVVENDRSLEPLQWCLCGDSPAPDRLILNLLIADTVVARCPHKSAPLYQASVASGGLLQHYLLADLLGKLGYTQYHIYAIDPGYESEDAGNVEERKQFVAWFQKKNTKLEFFNYTEDFQKAVKEGKAHPAHIADVEDARIGGKTLQATLLHGKLIESRTNEPLDLLAQDFRFSKYLRVYMEGEVVIYFEYDRNMVFTAYVALEKKILGTTDLNQVYDFQRIIAPVTQLVKTQPKSMDLAVEWLLHHLGELDFWVKPKEPPFDTAQKNATYKLELYSANGGAMPSIFLPFLLDGGSFSIPYPMSFYQNYNIIALPYGDRGPLGEPDDENTKPKDLYTGVKFQKIAP
jgi:hypothetical protein